MIESRGSLTADTFPITQDDGDGDTMRWAGAIDGWSNWMRAGGLRDLTISLRRYQIRRLAEDQLRRNPWRISTEDLSGWMARQSWAPGTADSYRAALRSFYRWGTIAGHVKRSPADALPTIHVPRGKPKPAPDAVFTAALARASDRDRLVLMLGAYAGLRRAEIAGLRWVDVEEASLRIRGKGGHVRLVPTHPALAADLGAEAARRAQGEYGTGYRFTAAVGDGWVFPGQSGGPISPNALGKVVVRLLGDGWTAHTLRHRFATRVYAGCRDVLVVQALLGHMSPSTTQRYVELPSGAMLAFVQAAGM